MLEGLSRHTAKRISQRNIRTEDIAFVMRFGQHLHNAGALFVFLGQRNIPDGCKADDRMAKLEGTTLVMSRDGCLITAYKNKKGLKKVLKKRKFLKKGDRVLLFEQFCIINTSFFTWRILYLINSRSGRWLP